MKKLFPVILLVLLAACSIFKKENNETEVKVFVEKFLQSLAGSDETILQQFEVSQPREALIKLVRVLQNKSNEYIQATLDESAAIIAKGDKGFEVGIPVRFLVVNLEDYADQELVRDDTLELTVAFQKDAWKITAINGEEVYNTFNELDNWIQWSAERERALLARESIYELARRLKPNFDSLLWYVATGPELYFYAVKGNWTGEKYSEKVIGDTSLYNLGLVDSLGKVIIPLEYDMLTTPGSLPYSWVEVTSGGKVGIWGMDEGKLLIPPQWDLVIPYGKNGISAIVKLDSAYSAYNYQFQPIPTLPETELNFVQNFQFLPTEFQVDKDNQVLAEMLYEPGYGIYVTPSYLRVLGFLPDYLTSIATTEAPLSGGIEYSRISKGDNRSLGEDLLAVLYSITERYLEGREEFYTNQRVVLMDSRRQVLSEQRLYADGEVSIRKVDEQLIEIRGKHTSSGEYGPPDEYWTDDFKYLSLEDGVVTELPARTFFPPAEFVPIDSSHFTGEFTAYKDTDQTEYTVNFFRLEVLRDLKNQLLALGGFIPADESLRKRLEGNNWYRGTTSNEQEAKAALSPVVQRNVEFIDRMIALQEKTILDGA